MNAIRANLRLEIKLQLEREARQLEPRARRGSRFRVPLAKQNATASGTVPKFASGSSQSPTPLRNLHWQCQNLQPHWQSQPKLGRRSGLGGFKGYK